MQAAKSSSNSRRNFEELHTEASNTPSQHRPPTSHPARSAPQTDPPSPKVPHPFPSGDDRGRTGNPCLAKAVLSQLSYVPDTTGHFQGNCGDPPVTPPPQPASPFNQQHHLLVTVPKPALPNRTQRGGIGRWHPVRRTDIRKPGPELSGAQTCRDTIDTAEIPPLIAPRQFRVATGSQIAANERQSAGESNGCTRIRTWDLSLIRAAL